MVLIHWSLRNINGMFITNKILSVQELVLKTIQ